MSVRRTIARNTAFNAGGRLWDAALTILITPYIVDRIGWPAWGLWSLVGSFTGYVGLLDLGMGSGLSKFVAEHAARDERAELSSVVSTAFYFYLIFGALIAVLAWPVCGVAVEAIAAWRGGAVWTGDATFLSRGAVILYAASMTIVPFSAIQTGLQRMGVANGISVVASLVKTVALVVLLEGGHGVRGLIYANGLATAFVALAALVAGFVLVPGLRVSPGVVTRKAFRRLWGFGWRAQIARLCHLVMMETDRLIVGFVFGLAAAGIYRAGEEIANKLRQVPVLLYSALVPAASDLDARGEAEKLKLLYVRTSKYASVVAVPMLLFGGAAAGMIMRTWFGDEANLHTAAWVLRIIVVGHLVNVLAGAGVSIALGKGRVDLQMVPGMISAGANVALTIVLVMTVGFYGVPAATTLAMLLGWAWLLRAMGPLVGVGALDSIRTSLVWPLVAALPGMAICVIGDVYTHTWIGRAPNGAALVACGALAALVYVGLIKVSPFFDAVDWNLFSDLRRVRASKAEGA